MTAVPKFSRHARWMVPAGAVAIAGAVTAGSMIGVAQASPELPAKTPAQLLAAVAGQTSPPPALTGTVVETAQLGIPQLPGLSNQNSAMSLLAGNHTVKVWYASPSRFRLSAPVSLGESDIIRNGRQVWLWQSSSNSVTKMQLPAKAGASPTPAPAPTGVPLTPQQAAAQALKAVGPSTAVSVQRTVTVAGQPAYQLALRPRSGSSLIGRVTIAIDAAKNVPLRVQVFARGARTAAFQVGYTQISFVAPAPANFSFTPPHGAKVKVVTVPAGTGSRQHAMAGQAAGQFQVVGKDWLSVAVLPASALGGLTGMGGAASAAAGQAAGSAMAGSGGGSGESAAVMGALLGSARAVHGSWGSGRLLSTSLLSVLITSNGHVLAGAVRPSVLYAAAAQVK